MPAISKRRDTLPLFCEVHLTVFIFGQEYKFAHAFLSLFYLFVLLLLFSYQHFGNIGTKLDHSISAQFNNF
jgi:hypothetical protein